MASCAVITTGITDNCENPPIGGVNPRVVLINKDDIDDFTENGSNSSIIEDITLGSGKTGYAWEGKKDSVNAIATFVKTTYDGGYDHEISMVVFDTTGATKKQLELLAKGSVVAVIETNAEASTASGALKYEVYGLNQGLEIAEMQRDMSSDDTQGAFTLILRTPEKLSRKEPKLPRTLFITDYATTTAVFEGLF